MKRTLCFLLLVAILLLTGCSSMLENRPYVVTSPHPEHPGTGSDPSSVSARTYPELVSAVLYFVSQMAETAHVQLIDYEGDAEADLRAACSEVAHDAPLGAYAVESIESSCTRVLTNYEAELRIAYRRTPEQVRAIVNVTGSAAIRRALADALLSFRPEATMRTAYFTEDVAYLHTMVQQAYYDTPAAALGFPKVEVNLYPNWGSQRIAEIQLSYRSDLSTLQARQQALQKAAQQAVAPLLAQGPTADLLLRCAGEHLRFRADPLPNGTPPDTPWDALVGEGGNSEGCALAFKLLCDLTGMDATVVEGTLNGAPHFWVRLTDGDGAVSCVDLSREGPPQALPEADLVRDGYQWAGMSAPLQPAAP